MKRPRSIAFLLVVATLLGTPFTGLAESKPKKHTEISTAFANAHSVYVEPESGDITNPDLISEDRQAVSAMENGLRDWDRYAVATRKDQADLVFRVKKGRPAGIQGDGSLASDAGPSAPPMQDPRRSSTPMGVGTMAAGPGDDLLQVFSTGPDGKLVGPIWTREMKDGLDGPRVPLLMQLKDAVERAFPTTPSKQP
jgi:hypothetical protein